MGRQGGRQVGAQAESSPWAVATWQACGWVACRMAGRYRQAATGTILRQLSALACNCNCSPLAQASPPPQKQPLLCRQPCSPPPAAGPAAPSPEAAGSWRHRAGPRAPESRPSAVGTGKPRTVPRCLQDGAQQGMVGEAAVTAGRYTSATQQATLRHPGLRYRNPLHSAKTTPNCRVGDFSWDSPGPCSSSHCSWKRSSSTCSAGQEPRARLRRARHGVHAWVATLPSGRLQRRGQIVRPSAPV